MKSPRGECPACGKIVALLKDGRLRLHDAPLWYDCDGGWLYPVDRSAPPCGTIEAYYHHIMEGERTDTHCRLVVKRWWERGGPAGERRTAA